MDLRIYYDDRCLMHDNGVGHPERSERVGATLRRVRDAAYASRVVAPEPADRSQLERVHLPAYVDEIAATADRDRTFLDADTSANRHSHLAARLAAGGAIAAVRAAIAGEEGRSFVLMRPPGHHACADRAMGFCLFNNAAVAAAEALASGLERVAIVDWDVHHGNGTESIFRERADVLYASLHQSPHYPGTGRCTDVGDGAGAGRTVNVPLPAGSGTAEYLLAMDQVVLPVLRRYAPELIIVSAGFDAHERDPLAGMLLTAVAYASVTERLVECAETCARGRIVHLLEGGYDLDALGSGVDAVLGVLAGASAAAEGAAAAIDAGGTAARMARESIASTRAALAPYWDLDA